jgi:hypothetical protein
MPIARFAHILQREGNFDSYLELLATAFNSHTLDGLMCRRLVSVGWDGFLYNCDFNQMLDLRLRRNKLLRLGEWPAAALVQLVARGDIRVDSHCYG